MANAKSFRAAMQQPRSQSAGWLECRVYSTSIPTGESSHSIRPFFLFVRSTRFGWHVSSRSCILLVRFQAFEKFSALCLQTFEIQKTAIPDEAQAGLPS